MREHLAWVGGMHGVGELGRLLDLGLRRLHPDQVGVRGVRLGTRGRQLDAVAQTVVAWLGLERWGEGEGEGAGAGTGAGAGAGAGAGEG